METCHTAEGINLATLAGLLEDVQGYEAAIPLNRLYKRYCGLSASKCCLINFVNNIYIYIYIYIYLFMHVPAYIHMADGFN